MVHYLFGTFVFALFSLPIGYYTFLRIVVTIGAVLIVISESDHGNMGVVALFALVAILFNPIFPVYLGSRSSWTIIDIITGILFGVYALFEPTKK